MNRAKKTPTSKGKVLGLLFGFVAVVALILGFTVFNPFNSNSTTNQVAETTTTTTTEKGIKYSPSQEEKEYLANRFAQLKGVNSEVIAYVYAPGTELDEPVVQTNDNSTYLDKTFEGGNQPYLGTVFMDMDNKKDFSDRLTWLFGHARGSKVGDHRMFNDVNYYDSQEYFDKHPYVVIETPERKYYYEAMGLVIVPEETAFYRTSFNNDQEFEEQLTAVYNEANVKKPNVTVSAKDKYLVLSTCREEDETIRSNLYLRQIPDSEMEEFVKQHGEQLAYKATR